MKPQRLPLKHFNSLWMGIDGYVTLFSSQSGARDTLFSLVGTDNRISTASASSSGAAASAE